MADVGALKTALLAHEGLRLTVYDDATGYPILPGTWVKGHPTIGIGRALDVTGVTLMEAQLLEDDDIARASATVAQTFPWYDGLSDARQNVILEMSFNIGVAGVQGFHQMIAAILASDWATAAAEMLDSQWAKQVGERAQELAQQMRTGTLS